MNTSGFLCFVVALCIADSISASHIFTGHRGGQFPFFPGGGDEISVVSGRGSEIPFVSGRRSEIPFVSGRESETPFVSWRRRENPFVPGRGESLVTREVPRIETLSELLGRETRSDIGRQPTTLQCPFFAPRASCPVSPCWRRRSIGGCPGYPFARCEDDFCGGCFARYFYSDQEITPMCSDRPSQTMFMFA